ncbi:EMC6-like membrane protein [Halococcus hamelinensis]|jgi:hypothetical protein|uniref:Uncharacterized protein n=1 Tax=Halococcus hamelinensis 100A6 TaxID=1132509 RepID=M0M791_9EURY|nr:hypothetical protein [Halococcus hamelinensis]EMA41566.1 hypothetical protein C447_01890 [Halococcus hamelinensis 100A6]
MSTETVHGRPDDHMRSLTVVALTSLSGIAAALVSSTLAGDAAQATVGLYPLAAAILVQLPALRLLGIDVEEFGLKDNLYVAFMTFAFWFVTWTILLTAGTAV